MFNHLRISKDEFKILFIDELDGLCRKRTYNENDHTRRYIIHFILMIESTVYSINIL